MIVRMHFGDGNFVELDMTADDPEEAVREAAAYVRDNAFFIPVDENGEDIAGIEARLSRPGRVGHFSPYY